MSRPRKYVNNTRAKFTSIFPLQYLNGNNHTVVGFHHATVMWLCTEGAKWSQTPLSRATATVSRTLRRCVHKDAETHRRRNATITLVACSVPANLPSSDCDGVAVYGWRKHRHPSHASATVSRTLCVHKDAETHRRRNATITQ